MRRAAFLLALLPLGGGGCEGIVCEHGYTFDGATGSASTGGTSECTVYVSSGANPGNDGLSLANPVATLDAALMIAGQQPSPVLCVSAGFYPGVAIRETVTIQGGYAMDFSTRNVRSFITEIGAPATQLEASLAPSILVDSPATGRAPAVVVDGCTIAGASGPNPTVGIHVTGGANATLSNDVIHGGAGACAMTMGFGSAGVLADTMATLSLTGDAIDGGTGGGPTCNLGSIAVSAQKSAANVSINGNPSISGGSGTADPMKGIGSFGIQIVVANAVITGNRIAGGTGNGAAGAVGLEVEAPAVSVTRNVVVASDSAAGHGTRYGVIVGPEGTIDAWGNLIHAGIYDPTNAAIGYGVVFSATKGSRLRFNTIYAGHQCATGGGDCGVPVYENTSSALDIEDNLLIAGGPHALVLGETGSVASFGFNASMGAVHPVLVAPPMVAPVEHDFGTPMAGFTGNVQLENTGACAGGPSASCVELAGCSDGPMCAKSVFTAWSTDPTAWLSSPNGLALAGGAPCAVRGSGHTPPPPEGFPPDFLGAARSTANPSMGTFENTNKNCP